ncbi:MAG: LD-carboxypeptidase [Gemmatimonadota bacterium]|nr:LD-carboxypeptidase [Gemmatimonadota bacterium]
MIRPRALRPGARVALVAPAGPLAPGTVELAEERVRALGWQPVVGASARGRRGFLSASDADRTRDLQTALDSADIDAIWCLRGGYGTMRIMDRINLLPLRLRPRPLIGFSDNTVLHLLATQAGVISFHGPHPAGAELTAFSTARLLEMVTGGEGPPPRFPMPEGQRVVTLVGGRAAGRLIGGNLALLAATVGTRAQMNAEGAVLVIEDVGEPLYRVDRMLTQLRLAGALDGLAGIVVGAFSNRPDEGDPALPSLAELLADRLGDPGVPLAYGFPFGHIPESWTLPIGATVTLDADAGTLALCEVVVEP